LSCLVCTPDQYNIETVAGFFSAEDTANTTTDLLAPSAVVVTGTGTLYISVRQVAAAVTNDGTCMGLRTTLRQQQFRVSWSTQACTNRPSTCLSVDTVLCMRLLLAGTTTSFAKRSLAARRSPLWLVLGLQVTKQLIAAVCMHGKSCAALVICAACNQQTTLQVMPLQSPLLWPHRSGKRWPWLLPVKRAHWPGLGWDFALHCRFIRVLVSTRKPG
jgi:hypothetical protein